jgi:site-specific recombinase
MKSTLKFSDQGKGVNTAAVETVLQRMVLGEEDPLLLIRDLINAVRPQSLRAIDSATLSWRTMVRLLEENIEYRQAMATVVLQFFSVREQRSLYTEAGLLPNTGFFSELGRKLSHKMLPELFDDQNLRDCFRLIFPKSKDIEWLRAIPEDDRAALWVAVFSIPTGNREALLAIRGQLLDSAVILGHRIAAMGLEPELVRVLPRLGRGESPFLALCDEGARFAARYRYKGEETEISETDERHLFVLLDQCRDTVDRAHHVAATQGTS